MRKFKLLNGDIVFGTCIAVAFIVIFYALAGLYWAMFWAGVAVSLAVAEYLSWRRTGWTLSQKMAHLLRTKPVRAYVLMLMMIALVALLIHHFIALSR